MNRQPQQRENERLHGEAKDGARDGVLDEAGVWFWFVERANQVMWLCKQAALGGNFKYSVLTILNFPFFSYRTVKFEIGFTPHSMILC